MDLQEIKIQFIWNQLLTETGNQGLNVRLVKIPNNQRLFDISTARDPWVIDGWDIQWFGLFELFTDNEIKGILVHELGHILDKGLNLRSRSKQGFLLTEEIADIYAAAHGYAKENISAQEKLNDLERSGRLGPAAIPQENRIKLFKHYVANA